MKKSDLDAFRKNPTVFLLSINGRISRLVEDETARYEKQRYDLEVNYSKKLASIQAATHVIEVELMMEAIYTGIIKPGQTLQDLTD